MQIFSLAQKITPLFDLLSIYRIRPNSASQHTLTHKNHKDNTLTFPPHQQDLLQAFKGDVYTLRHYRFAYSCAIICLKMDEFLKKEKLSVELQEILKAMIEVRAFYAFGGCGFQKDPRNVREICSKLLNYTQRVRLSSKLAYYFPQLYKIIKKIKKP